MTLDEFSALAPKEALRLTNQLISTANKRYRRAIEGQYAEISPAISAAMDRPGATLQRAFSSKGVKSSTKRGKVTKELKGLYGDVKTFLQNKTASYKGTMTFKKNVDKFLDMLPGGKWRSKAQARDFYEVMRKFMETPEAKRLGISKGRSSELRDVLATMIGDYSERTEKRHLIRRFDPSKQGDLFKAIAERLEDMQNEREAKAKEGEEQYSLKLLS